ncbi:MAG: phosphoenolpyruvate--protein phosphotransferase [Candidatus Aminicenantia bacterium]
MEVIKGIPVNPGIAIGNVWIKETPLILPKKKSLTPSEIEEEIKFFGETVHAVKEDIKEMKKKVSAQIGADASLVFDSHLLLLEDAEFIEEIKSIIYQGHTLGWALSIAREKFLKIFEKIEDEYIKERVYDVCDVINRIQKKIANFQPFTSTIKREQNMVLVAYELLPSEIPPLFDLKGLKGIVLQGGSKTAHSVILAKSLSIAIVIGAKGILSKVKNGDKIVVDGRSGEVMIEPSSNFLTVVSKRRKSIEMQKEEALVLAKMPSVTEDGHPFALLANIEMAEESEVAIKNGAEGIGLFRTEFFLLNSRVFQSEESQFNYYKKAIEKIFGKSFVIRTFDVGGEKVYSYESEKEMNPALGLRAIRLMLKRRELLIPQLRAILRASNLGDLKILIPMITSLEELNNFKEIVEETKYNLKKEGIPFNEKIEIGVMIEVPASALISDSIAKNADFLSLGTNDLIQYTLAIDRTNQNVSYLYNPLHPSILRILKFVRESAQRYGKMVYVCGEMSSEPLYAIALLGIGINVLSMNPIYIPMVKKVLRKANFKKAKEIMERALEFPPEEMENFILKEINLNFGDIIRET